MRCVPCSSAPFFFQLHGASRALLFFLCGITPATAFVFMASTLLSYEHLPFPALHVQPLSLQPSALTHILEPCSYFPTSCTPTFSHALSGIEPLPRSYLLHAKPFSSCSSRRLSREVLAVLPLSRNRVFFLLWSHVFSPGVLASSSSTLAPVFLSAFSTLFAGYLHGSLLHIVARVE